VTTYAALRAAPLAPVKCSSPGDLSGTHRSCCKTGLEDRDSSRSACEYSKPHRKLWHYNDVSKVGIGTHSERFQR
jgi:hypothetical protein